ncbi:MAG: 3-phosphoglycerate dehydrogenase [Proteobacteria bacterium]|nr:3-phosphoglycerate dehydrogenase [Pseudomonadota bacterium]
MYKIQTLNKISAQGLSLFPADRYTIGSDLSDADAILVRSADLHEMTLDATVSAIARAGAGVNNIPIAQCTQKGIVVFNTPGANANAVAELVLLGLLASSRPIIRGAAWEKSLIGHGDEIPKMVEKGKSQFVGPEIKGKTLGIIGLGAIGSIVANGVLALGMDVIGYDPFLTKEAAAKLDPRMLTTTNLNDVYEKSDYLSLHVPQTPDTKHMISSESIALMKHGVRIMNFSRAGLVDTASLVAALEAGKVACYVTDFGDEKLLQTENAICLPHLGASTPEAEENCAYMAVNQIVDFLEQGNIVNSVNFPKITLDAGQAAQRFTITALGNADFEAQIRKAISGITALVAKTRDTVSYAIVEVSAAIDTHAISGIDGLVGIRVCR